MHFLNRSIVLAACLAAGVVLNIPRVHAVPITFRNGLDNAVVNDYEGADDASIYGHANHDDQNYGGYVYFDINEAANGGPQRGLIRFDLSSMAGHYQSITSATLTLYAQPQGSGTGDFTISVYQITSANAGWGEGTGHGSTATTGEATWNNKNAPDGSWAGSAGLSTAGTDYVNTVLGSAEYRYDDPQKTALGAPLTITLSATLIQDWIEHPGQNAGLLLKSNGTLTTNTGRIKGSEDSTAEYRPTLVINYAPVPEPMSLGLLAAGGGMMLLRRRR
jgi:hypothetical protein